MAFNYDGYTINNHLKTYNRMPRMSLPRIITTSIYATYCMAVVWYVSVKYWIFESSSDLGIDKNGNKVLLVYDKVWKMEKIKKGINVTRY